jgi:lipopolysaccharide transport protein LptA
MTAMPRPRARRTVTRFRVLLMLSLLAAVGVVGGLYMFGAAGASHPGRARGDAPQFEQGTRMIGKDFDYTFSQGERTIFRVRGDSVRVDKDDTVFLENVGITLFDKDGRQFDAESDHGSINRNTNEGQLWGDVSIKGPSHLEIYSNQLLIQEKGNLLVTPRLARILYAGKYFARCDSLQAWLPDEIYSMIGNVRVETFPEVQPPLKLEADRAIYERKRRQLRVESGEIRRGPAVLDADRMSGLLSEDESSLTFVRALSHVSGETAETEAPGTTKISWAGDDMAVLLTPKGNQVRQVNLDSDAARPAILQAAGKGLTRTLVAPHIEGTLAEKDILRTANAYGGVDIEEVSPPSAAAIAAASNPPRPPAAKATAPGGAKAAAPGGAGKALPPGAAGGRAPAPGPGGKALAEGAAKSSPAQGAGKSSPAAEGTAGAAPAKGPGGASPGRKPGPGKAAPPPPPPPPPETPAQRAAREGQERVATALAAAAATSTVGPRPMPAVAPGAPVPTLRRAHGQRADATFRSDGQIATVVMIEHVTYGDAEINASGDRSEMDMDAGRGDFFGKPADVQSARGDMRAPHIIYTSADQLMHAVEGVKAEIQQANDAALAGSVLGAGKGPVRVDSLEAFWKRPQASFIFRGDVRAWRGDNLLLTPELVGERLVQGDQLSANTGVKTVWIPEEKEAAPGGAAGARTPKGAAKAAAPEGGAKAQGEGAARAAGTEGAAKAASGAAAVGAPTKSAAAGNTPPGSPGAPPPPPKPGTGVAGFGKGPQLESRNGPITVLATNMLYRDVTGVLSYKGNVHVDQDTRTLTCEQLDVELDKNHKATRMTCNGQTHFDDPSTGRKIDGESAVYRVEIRKIDILGNPVLMHDREGNIVHGMRLRYSIDDGKVEVLGKDDGPKPAPPAPMTATLPPPVEKPGRDGAVGGTR